MRLDLPPLTVADTIRPVEASWRFTTAVTVTPGGRREGPIVDGEVPVLLPRDHTGYFEVHLHATDGTVYVVAEGRKLPPLQAPTSADSVQAMADFLLARIIEDEAFARAATAGPWRYNPDKRNGWDSEESVFAGPAGRGATCVASTGPMDDPQSMADAGHIAHWDPARVLAECAAKREIIKRALDNEELWGPDQTNDYDLHILPALLLPYADHPDYRKAWRS